MTSSILDPNLWTKFIYFKMLHVLITRQIGHNITRVFMTYLKWSYTQSLQVLAKKKKKTAKSFKCSSYLSKDAPRIK